MCVWMYVHMCLYCVHVCRCVTVGNKYILGGQIYCEGNFDNFVDAQCQYTGEGPTYIRVHDIKGFIDIQTTI